MILVNVGLPYEPVGFIVSLGFIWGSKCLVVYYSTHKTTSYFLKKPSNFKKKIRQINNVEKEIQTFVKLTEIWGAWQSISQIKQFLKKFVKSTEFHYLHRCDVDYFVKELQKIRQINRIQKFVKLTEKLSCNWIYL